MTSVASVVTTITDVSLVIISVFFQAKNRTRVPGITKRKSKIRAIWGKVTRPHGSTGAVRAKFKVNLPPTAMGRRIRIVSHLLFYTNNVCQKSLFF